MVAYYMGGARPEVVRYHRHPPLCFVLISRIVDDINIHKDSPVDPAMTLVLLYTQSKPADGNMAEDRHPSV
jgi:hypothetical protein